jgi:hypothetical protein
MDTQTIKAFSRELMKSVEMQKRASDTLVTGFMGFVANGGLEKVAKSLTIPHAYPSKSELKQHVGKLKGKAKSLKEWAKEHPYQAAAAGVGGAAALGGAAYLAHKKLQGGRAGPNPPARTDRRSWWKPAQTFPRGGSVSIPK